MTRLKNRHESGWSRKGEEYLSQIIEVISGLREYWPLTLRQIYYQLVGQQIIENSLKEYGKLSRMTTKARLQGVIDWTAIEDRSRSMTEWQQYESREAFIDEQRETVFDGYIRNLMQSQLEYLEIWTEKDALSSLFKRVAGRYGIPVIVARGFSSISFVFELRSRVDRELSERERPTRIIYLGDFDPSGVEMLPSMLQTLYDEMGVCQEILQGDRIALLPEQIEQHDLPSSPDAVKLGDTRAKKFIEQYGSQAVELDALPPEVLMDILENAIREKLDLSKFDEEIQQQKHDRQQIQAVRDKVLEVIGY